MLKTIFHVDEREKWPLAIINIKNFIKDFQGDCKISLLANAIAVKDLLNSSDYKKDFDKLMELGVDIIACNNALRANGLGKEDLIRGLRIVDSGVIELSQKQADGYAYIKP